MKKIIGMLVVVLLISSIVGTYWYITTNNKWVDETQFGNWGQEIILEYVDGSTQQLKGFSAVPFALLYDGSQISAIRYILSAKAFSDKYDFCEVDLTSYSINLVLSGPDSFQSTISNFASKDINVDGTWKILTNTRITADTILPISEDLADGEYTLTIQPSGSVKYRGFKTGRIDFGDWKPALLPSSIIFGITKQIDSEIYLNLDHDIGTEISEWSWSFVAGFQTDITLPLGAMICVGGSSPEIVFASISDKISSVMQQQDNTWKSWVPGRAYNTLTNILPDVTLYVSVYEDCVLTISCS